MWGIVSPHYREQAAGKKQFILWIQECVFYNTALNRSILERREATMSELTTDEGNGSGKCELAEDKDSTDFSPKLTVTSTENQDSDENLLSIGVSQHIPTETHSSDDDQPLSSVLQSLQAANNSAYTEQGGCPTIQQVIERHTPDNESPTLTTDTAKEQTERDNLSEDYKSLLDVKELLSTENHGSYTDGQPPNTDKAAVHIKRCSSDEDDRLNMTVKQQEKTDTQSSEEDDQPLITVKRRLMLETCELDEPDASDDSAKDPTFHVKRKDLVTSSSTSEEEDLQTQSVKTKKRKTAAARKKLRKSNADSLSSKGQLNTAKEQGLKHKSDWNISSQVAFKRMKSKPTTPKSSVLKQASSLAKAKRESSAAFKVKKWIFSLHSQTLDALLASNGFIRKQVQGDGNCLFAAVAGAGMVDKDVLSLRTEVCKHMEENVETYMAYLTNQNKSDETYKQELESLKKDGNWKGDLADALPLAIANTLNRDILIYTSKRDMPVVNIKATSSNESSGESITLAYFAVRGQEHYDACQPIAEVGSSHQRTPAKATDVSSPQKTPNQKKIITPRKRAHYVSPRKQKGTRKRTQNPSMWKKNIRKANRLSGQAYQSTTGKWVKAKQIQQVDCSKCRWHCSSGVPMDQRQKFFDTYWGLQSYERQRDFICCHIKEQEPDRVKRSAKRTRKYSRRFYMESEEGTVRVCKTFFSQTLDIGDGVIDNALKGKRSGMYAFSDCRGKHSPHNVTPSADIDAVKEHIESFPTIEAHYTRKDTRRQFLGSELNITKMYSLYQEECQANNRKAVSKYLYRKVFCTEYNYSFHVPKKDQCRTCSVYQQAVCQGSVTDELKKDYDEHIARKIRAREEKSLDKSFSRQNNNFHTATFDLQAVLPIPCSRVSQVYYKRKLSCYNLSVYSLDDGNASCFLWNESEGRRGSCEIGTCLTLYLKSLPSSVSHVCFYSDSCAGQNKNRFVATALLHALATSENLTTIDQKYLQSGHTQMECDSMHAAIEVCKKLTSVYVPSQWDTIVRMARKRKPYNVIPLKHQDILNFKPIAQHMIPQAAIDTEGRKVQWMKICWLQFRKHELDRVFFKYDFEEELFHTLKLKSLRRGKYSIEQPMSPCYESKLPISEQKKKDLLSLCTDRTIPEEFHAFFQNLPTSTTAHDCLPDPDVLESDSDSEQE